MRVIGYMKGDGKGEVSMRATGERYVTARIETEKRNVEVTVWHDGRVEIDTLGEDNGLAVRVLDLPKVTESGA